MSFCSLVVMLASSFSLDLIEAGCDEVGRGCLAGPVVAAAVILPKDYEHGLLTDSKKLGKKKREKLEEDIKRDALDWAIGVVDNTKIDEINILSASFLAMHKAVDQLNIKPELLLVDGNRFTPYTSIPHHCIIKGDSLFLSIAAASILAKTYRDNLMLRMAKEFPVYAWDRNVGYPTKKHRAAIQAYGPSPLHRMSFKLLSS